MNKKEECEIVKDLSSLHIENILSQGSKDFVDKHLRECESCRKYYKDLNSMFLNEEKSERKNDEIEINHLKKVNKKMTTLKWILFGIIVAILVSMFYFYFKIIYIDSINDLNINKMLDMQRNSSNYKLEHKTTEINKKTNETSVITVVHYYKDGRNKVVSSLLKDGKMVEESIRFIDDYAYEKVNVFNSLKQIDYQKQDFIEVRQGYALDMIISRVMNNDAGIHRLGLTTRTEVFEGKECYVVSDSHNGTYRDNYIDKATGNLVRVLSESENFYNEEVFTLIEDTVTDEDVDVSILDSEKYTDYKRNYIDYKIDENIRWMFEK